MAVGYMQKCSCVITFRVYFKKIFSFNFVYVYVFVHEYIAMGGHTRVVAPYRQSWATLCECWTRNSSSVRAVLVLMACLLSIPSTLIYYFLFLSYFYYFFFSFSLVGETTRVRNRWGGTGRLVRLGYIMWNSQRINTKKNKKNVHTFLQPLLTEVVLVRVTVRYQAPTFHLSFHVPHPTTSEHLALSETGHNVLNSLCRPHP